MWSCIHYCYIKSLQNILDFKCNIVFVFSRDLHFQSNQLISLHVLHRIVVCILLLRFILLLIANKDDRIICLYRSFINCLNTLAVKIASNRSIKLISKKAKTLLICLANNYTLLHIYNSIALVNIW